MHSNSRAAKPRRCGFPNKKTANAGGLRLVDGNGKRGIRGIRGIRAPGIGGGPQGTVPSPRRQERQSPHCPHRGPTTA
ncbi:MAG: hypothetical protein AMXMBFR55_04110 [Gemmatimonadota bacterium]